MFTKRQYTRMEKMGLNDIQIKEVGEWYKQELEKSIKKFSDKLNKE